MLIADAATVLMLMLDAATTAVLVVITAAVLIIIIIGALEMAHCHCCGSWGLVIGVVSGGLWTISKGVFTVAGVLVTAAIAVFPDGTRPAINAGGGRCKS